jgi:hypothetical protein
MRVHAFLAVGAFPAGRDAGNQNVVANFEGGNVPSNLLNDSDTFVPQYPAIGNGRHIAFQYVQIRPANGRFGDLDDGVRGRLDGGFGLFFQCALAGAVVHECFHGWVSYWAMG